MKIAKQFINKYFFFLIVFLHIKTYSQEKKKNIESNTAIDQILTEKRRLNSSIYVNDNYKIQIYFGGLDDSKKALIEFKKQFKKYDGTILFNNPNYKVWIGSFKHKIDAERNLNILKKKYPEAIIIIPNKK